VRCHEWAEDGQDVLVGCLWLLLRLQGFRLGAELG
jgi:hypothetical protein